MSIAGGFQDKQSPRNLAKRSGRGHHPEGCSTGSLCYNTIPELPARSRVNVVRLALFYYNPPFSERLVGPTATRPGCNGPMADQLERAGAALGRCPSPSAPQSEARCGAWLSRRMLAGRLDREGRARGFGATATFRGGPPGAVKQSRRAML